MVGASLILAVTLAPLGLLARGPDPRWGGVIAGLALAGGLVCAIVAHGLLRGAKPTLLVPVVAAAVLAGGAGGFYLAFSQEVGYDQSPGTCAIGPWTATWRASEDLFRSLPDTGVRGSFSIERVDPGEMWPRAPDAAPEGWQEAAVTTIRWNPSAERLGEWDEGTISVSVDNKGGMDGDGLRVFVRLEGQGVQDIARELAVEALMVTTSAPESAIENWTAHMGEGTVEDPFVERAYPKNVTFDLSGFVADRGRDGWNVTWGPPIGPVPEVTEIHHGKGNWTVNTLAPVKFAEGDGEGTAVRLAVSSTNHVALYVDESGALSDDAWDALAEDVYEQLALGPAPEHDWSPVPSAVC